MRATEAIERRDGGSVAQLRLADGFVYETEPCETEEDAQAAARKWLHWYENVLSGTVESIYYILSVPDIWPGPPAGGHRYSGLRVKIGRTRNVKKRLADLRTGTPGDLIVHALEPGSSQLETQRHHEFASDRGQGEWFFCSPRLMAHVFAILKRNRGLPEDQWIEVLQLQDRIDALLQVRDVLGGPPGMVNPSLDEPWVDRTFIDLRYAGWRASMGKPLRPGAIPLDLTGLPPQGFGLDEVL
ncbi:MAG: GIY-YIG nuclease family protein [Dehalococcoidia bacterium]|nr:GIY-YIG nuclease family protein [Dehalococcoidia bacterium]